MPDGEVPAIQTLDGTGESCATLTPVIAAQMRRLRPGDRIAVVSDDDSAPEAIAAWARLTGHRLLEAHAEAAGRHRFVLEHRPESRPEGG